MINLRRPAHPVQKLLFLGVLVLILYVWVELHISCLFRRWTGIPCPGCGLTRACLAILRGDWGAAFRYHPMFWSLPVFMLFYFFDGKPFRCDRLNRWVLFGLVAAFFGCYIIRLICFLGGTLTI